MSSNIENPPSAPADDIPEAQQSKKAEASSMQEMLRRPQEADAVASSAAALVKDSIDDSFSENYGDVNSNGVRSKVSADLQWSHIKSLSEEMNGQEVLFRGRAHAMRIVSENTAFLVVRGSGPEKCTVLCVLSVALDFVSQQMVKFATLLNRESVIVVNGIVSIPSAPNKLISQQVEVQVRRIYCISRAQLTLPFIVEGAHARSDSEFVKVLQEPGERFQFDMNSLLHHSGPALRKSVDKALNNLQVGVEHEAKNFLISEGFTGIETPLTSVRGGTNDFELDYMRGRPGRLAQSPNINKRNVILGVFNRIFEYSPVFRAEPSSIRMHLCDHMGMDVEMRIMHHYSEVMDIVDSLFVSVFDYLNENCKEHLEAIDKQFPFEPLKYLRKTIRLTFQEGLEMLKEAGVEVDPYGDLSTESERKLGQLVLNKYDTDFYILHKYPLAVRPYYTMPCDEDNLYSNSFDVFIRGEKSISGGQFIDDSDLLTARAEARGIDVMAISSYVGLLRAYPAARHGGFGVGLERVVIHFCGLDISKKTSMGSHDSP